LLRFVNGVLAAPLMAVMMLIVRNPKVMGRLTVSRAMAIWGWAATGVMAAASLAFFILSWIGLKHPGRLQAPSNAAAALSPQC
jgi:Mn2+/Fe2+ NRAMP family transporter